MPGAFDGSPAYAARSRALDRQRRELDEPAQRIHDDGVDLQRRKEESEERLRDVRSADTALRKTRSEQNLYDEELSQRHADLLALVQKNERLLQSARKEKAEYFQMKDADGAAQSRLENSKARLRSTNHLKASIDANREANKLQETQQAQLKKLSTTRNAVVSSRTRTLRSAISLTCVRAMLARRTSRCRQSAPSGRAGCNS